MSNNLPLLSKEKIEELRAIRNKGISNLRTDYPKDYKYSVIEGIVGHFENMVQPGFLMRYGEDIIVTYGSISGFISHEYYYRGENQIYPGEATSSLGRELKKEDDLTVYVKLLLQNIKINIFTNLLISNEMLNHWKYGTILTYMIAQHYGLKTQYLDITDDIEIALFFANTSFEGGEFKPILESNIDKYGEYAVLYHKLDYPNPNFEKDGKMTFVRPIGYQPFTRCHKQRGYFIDTNEFNKIQTFGLASNYGFTKYKFERDDKLTLELMKKFDYGKKIYPDESKDKVLKLIKKVNSIKEVTFNEIKEAKKITIGEYRDDVIIKKLKELKINVMDNLNREELNEDIKFIDFEEFVKKEQIKISWRLVRKP